MDLARTTGAPRRYAWARAIGVSEDLVARYVPGEVDVTGLADERSQVVAFNRAALCRVRSGP